MKEIYFALSKHEAHREFLNNLPNLSLGKAFFKIILTGILSFVLIILLILISEGLKLKGNIIENFVYLAAVISCYFIFYKGHLRKTLADLLPKTINRSIKFFLLIFAIDFLIVLVFGLININNSSQELINNAAKQIASESGKKSFLVGLLSSFFIMFIGAAAEEFLFRFTIFRVLRKFGFFFAAIVSSFFFILIHQLSAGSIISNLLFGLLMCFYYEYSNSFLRISMIHTIHNLFFVGIVYFIVAPLLLGRPIPIPLQ